MAKANKNPFDHGRRPAPVIEPLAAADSITHAAGHKNMQQLIQLRWIAVVGQVATIATASMLLDVQLPMPAMLNVLACLIAFNIASTLRWQENQVVSNSELLLALTVDVASLTAQLYLSGGATNPFVFLYLLHVILGAVLLETWSTWTIAGVTGMCIASLALFSEPLRLPLDQERGIMSLYVQGMLLCFIFVAALLVVFVNRIMRNMRTTASKLADLRQRAAEEEHIVRMGLLASGAAHELGTPLATLAVILGDWKHMPEFKGNPILLEEIGEMQTQLQRCKSIVSGILLSAGETRGESSAATTINTFLDEVVAEWRFGRPVQDFEFDNRITLDVPVVSDSTLKQMISNVLDNALEASPHWLRLEAHIEHSALVLTVTDAGPGFAEAILAQFGKPYNSSKGRPGGGLGLFLVVNVARTLGGAVTASNLEQGGAVVRLSLPLSAIEIQSESTHDY
jgi:two-component system sensor histidine kinase RegB